MTKEQKDCENLDDYARRFKSAKDIYLSWWGSDIRCTNLAKTYVGWDTEDETVRSECSEGAQEDIYTTIFILGASTSKYNTRFTTLDTHFSLGNDKYPKKLEDAKGVLNSHQWDKIHYDSQKRKSSQNGKDPKEKQGNPKRDNDSEPKVVHEDMEFAQI